VQGATPSFKNILIVPTSERYSGIKLTTAPEDKKEWGLQTESGNIL